MKDLLEEGRKIQESFKKNVLNESETITSKFDPKLYIKVGDDSITFITPFGNITFEVAGQYDDFSTDGGVAMDYTAPRGGISRSEWEKATERIFDFVTNEPDYLKATKKLLDPKVLTMYLPQITKGAKATSPSYNSGMASAQAGGKGTEAYRRKESFKNLGDTNKVLKKIPSKLRNKRFLYVGRIIRPKDMVGARGLVDVFYSVISDVLMSYDYDEQKTLKYFDSLYMKPGDDTYIYSNLRGKEEVEFKRLH